VTIQTTIKKNSSKEKNIKKKKIKRMPKGENRGKTIQKKLKDEYEKNKVN